jgi:SpoVK/Ycf46/Vps4 family AAA+-type ATPase
MSPKDSAFVDRADIVQYVDLPSRDAIYEILRTCLCEIVTKGIVAPIVCTRPEASLNVMLNMHTLLRMSQR